MIDVDKIKGRIRELMAQCGHPNSNSVYSAFMQLSNEFSQGCFLDKEKAAPAVDVEGLKKPYLNGASLTVTQRRVNDHRKGWNDCLNELAARGLIRNAPHPGVKRLADFILKLDMGHPRASDQKPDGEDVYEAAISIITELINKQNAHIVGEEDGDEPIDADIITPAVDKALRHLRAISDAAADAQERGDE